MAINPALEAALARLTPDERTRLSRAITAAGVAALNELAAKGRAMGDVPPGDSDVVAFDARRGDDAGRHERTD